MYVYICVCVCVCVCNMMYVALLSYFWDWFQFTQLPEPYEMYTVGGAWSVQGRGEGWIQFLF